MCFNGEKQITPKRGANHRAVCLVFHCLLFFVYHRCPGFVGGMSDRLAVPIEDHRFTEKGSCQHVSYGCLASRRRNIVQCGFVVACCDLSCSIIAKERILLKFVFLFTLRVPVCQCTRVCVLLFCFLLVVRVSARVHACVFLSVVIVWAEQRVSCSCYTLSLLFCSLFSCS